MIQAFYLPSHSYGVGAQVWFIKHSIWMVGERIASNQRNASVHLYVTDVPIRARSVFGMAYHMWGTGGQTTSAQDKKITSQHGHTSPIIGPLCAVTGVS